MIEFDFDNIISKLMAEKILSIIKEKKRIKAIEIANILGTDRKTVNHYLYSDLRRVVEKDQMHYWSLKGRRPKLSSDDVYYLTEYIPKRLGGVHLWGKSISSTGRKIAHCGDLNSYFGD